MPSSPRGRILGFLILTAAGPQAVVAQQVATFDHAACAVDEDGSCRQSTSMELRNGDVFEVVVTNTFNDEFTYDIRGIEEAKSVSGEDEDAITAPEGAAVVPPRWSDVRTILEEEGIDVTRLNEDSPATFCRRVSALRAAKQSLESGNENVPPVLNDAIAWCEARDWTERVSLNVIHNDRYGGYVVTVSRRDEGDVHLDRREARFIVRVEDSGWDVDFSGGFAVTGLTDDKFFLQSIDTTRTEIVDGTPTLVPDTLQVIARDEENEDDVTLGITSMITVYHSDLPWLGPSFGIGINDNLGAQYYFGATLRAGSRAFLSGGVVFGPVDRLPTGRAIRDPVSDPNVLTDLPHRTRPSFYISVGFNFLGDRDRFAKPFAGATSLEEDPDEP